MKPQPSVLTAAATASAAGRKAKRIQRKLTLAESELQASIKVLAKPDSKRPSAEVKDALKHNVAAETKVHEATEELEVVAQLLSDVKDALPVPPGTVQPGRSGEGAKSTIPHLRNGA